MLPSTLYPSLALSCLQTAILHHFSFILSHPIESGFHLYHSTKIALTKATQDVLSSVLKEYSQSFILLDISAASGTDLLLLFEHLL